jgi:hypothetical protein
MELRDTAALTNDQRNSHLDSLFGNINNVAEIEVVPPSKCVGYKTSVVKIKPLTFEDEYKILKNGKDPINSIISNCVIGVDIQDILLCDKVFFLMKIREVSYGDSYKFDIVCPACKTNTRTTLELSKLLIIYDENFSTEKEYTLPFLKRSIKLSFPRVIHENELTSDDTPKNIWKFITELDGKSDPLFINKAWQRMHIADKKFILTTLLNPGIGIETNFVFECPNCKHTDIIEVPFNSNFFSVS